MPIPYYLAAQRTDRALYQLDTVVSCPGCDEHVTATVYGDDVELTAPCSERCHESSGYRWDVLRDAALTQAQGERLDYLNHLRDGGE